MHKKILFFFLLYIAASSLVFSQTGAVSGFVYNGSADSAIVSGIDVELLVYQGHSLIDDSTYVQTTNERGEFSFHAVPFDTLKTYYPRATFEGVVYYGHGARLFPGHGSLQSSVVVYDTTSLKNMISFQLEHLFIEPEEEGIRMREIFIIQNMGTKTFIGQNYSDSSGSWVLKFPLPEHFHDLEILTPEARQSVFIKEGNLLTTDLLSPGSRQLSYRYFVPHKKGDWHYTRDTLYPIGEVNIFISNPEVSLEGPGIMPMGNFPIRNINYKRYSVRGLMPGKTLDITVTNLPDKSFPVKWVVLIAVGILLVVGFGYTLRKS
ncbi:MAG: hypothetical protein ACOY90_10170 [Candidatus Zhuqueibacterota bacterium]